MLFNSSQNDNTDSEYDDDDDIDVESNGPEIAAAQKSKVMVIAAATLLITIVIYFLYFKTDKVVKEDLVEIKAPTNMTKSYESPFELEDVSDVYKVEEDIIVEKPSVPEIPTLPELPEDSVLADNSIFPEEEPIIEKPVQEIKPLEPVIINNPIQETVQPIQPNGTPTQATTNSAALQAAAELDPRYAPIIVFSAAAGGSPARSVGYERNIVNLNQDPIDALEKTPVGVTATFISDRSHTIAQGKLLTAVLETAINTEIPGLVRAIVSRDVYGEAGSDVLIPRGSRLFGAYSSKITQGQGRVEIAWTRLIRPDGVDLAINFNASDQFGRAGLSGDVNNRYGSVIANSILTSILAVGGVVAAESLLDNAATTTTTDPSNGTTTSTGSASSQALFDVSKTIMDTVGTVIGNTIDINPIIRVPQGTRITVIVNADIVVPSMSEQ